MDRGGPNIKAIFTGALGLPEGAGRAAKLDRACGGDAGLRHRVEALPAAYARADDVLGPAGLTWTEDNAPAGDVPGSTTVAEPTGPGRTVDQATHAADHDATTAAGVDAEGLASGERVRYFGDYEIRGELGRGGMGVVHEACQVSLNRAVALKMLKAGLLAGENELRRFRSEAEAVALLDHPGVVPMYEVGSHNGQHYFSMKLVPSGSLVPLMHRYRADPRAPAHLVARLAEAVAHAHDRGILHRDIKPAIAIREALVREIPGRTQYLVGLADNHRNRGLARRALGDFAGSAADGRRALALCDALPWRMGESWFLSARAHAGLAGLAGSGVSAAEAAPEAETAVALLRETVAMGYRSPHTYRTEDALDPLRDRPDFRLLMMDLAMPADPFAP